MIVVDASAMVELLLQTLRGTRVAARLRSPRETWHAPHLLDIEVTQALRRLVRIGEVRPGRAREALGDLATIDLRRHAHVDLLERAWALRDNLTAHDAVYVALAETLRAPLVTCDAPLSASPGHVAHIDVID